MPDKILVGSNAPRESDSDQSPLLQSEQDVEQPDISPGCNGPYTQSSQESTGSQIIDSGHPGNAISRSGPDNAKGAHDSVSVSQSRLASSGCQISSVPTDCGEGGGSGSGLDIQAELHDGRHGGYVAYAERWYILAIYSLVVFIQSLLWNTWGPIEDTAIAVLGWDAATIALLANWGPIMYLVSAFFFSWLLHAKGLRVAILLTGGLLVVGAGVRCIPVPIPMMKWTIHLGHVFIGLAGPVAMAAVTSISATWFPTNERTTATALASTVAVVGIACSFLIGPLIVGEVTSSNTTTTTVIPVTASESFFITGQEDTNECLLKIKQLLLIEFGFTALVFLAAVIYFPAAPVTPPTASAETKREDMRAGMVAILKKVSFWIPALAYGIITGAYNAWASQMDVIFQDEIDQTTAGWLGFYTNIAGLVGGVLAARCSDYLGGRMKAILLVLIVACCGSLLWTLLLVNKYIPYSEAYIFTSVILFGLFLNSTVPLFFELTVEGAFPVGEETTTMLMTWLNNVYALVFLVLPMFSSLNKDLSWLNWFMLASAVICIPLMLVFREQYKRREVDITHHDDSVSRQDDGESG